MSQEQKPQPNKPQNQGTNPGGNKLDNAAAWGLDALKGINFDKAGEQLDKLRGQRGE